MFDLLFLILSQNNPMPPYLNQAPVRVNRRACQEHFFFYVGCVMICFTLAAQRHSCFLFTEPFTRVTAGSVDRGELRKERKG